MPHSSSSSPVTYLPVHITFPSFFSLVSRESWRNRYINLSLFFLTSLFLLAWISGFLSVDHDHDLGWGVTRRAVGFVELWGHPIWFRQVAYSGVLLLWLGFRVGLSWNWGWVCYCGWDLEWVWSWNWGWVWSWKVPFLSLTGGVWLCRKGLRIRRGTSST